MKRYVGAQGWVAYGRPPRDRKLAGLGEWLEERLFRHRGNAEVVRQDLKRELSVDASLRTVERAVAPYRRLLAAEAKSTLRIETPSGRQLQIDFGESPVPIVGERTRAHLFVPTLGCSRRTYAKALRAQRQSAWFAGIEGAFLHFGGVIEEVLVDNAKPLVVRHDAVTREVEFNERFLAFAAHWGFRPRACAPYRARTKARTRTGCATSSATPSRATGSRVWARWKAIWRGRCGRSPTSGGTAPPARRRWRASSGWWSAAASCACTTVPKWSPSTTSIAADTGASRTGRILTASTRAHTRSAPCRRRGPIRTGAAAAACRVRAGRWRELLTWPRTTTR